MRLRIELLTLIRLALPVALAQLLTAATGLVDTLMAGRAGVKDLAGVSLGSAIWLTLSIGIMGLFMAVNPIVAQYVGARHYPQIPVFMHQAVRVAIVSTLILYTLLKLHSWYLPGIIADLQVLQVTGDYLDGFSWGVPALVGIFVLRPYSEGLAFTRPHLIASLVSLAINIPANYALIFGHWGAPALGGAGAGWATALSFWAAFSVMAWYSRHHLAYRKASLWCRFHPRVPIELVHLLRVGLPVALTLFVEVSIFSLVALFIGGRPDTEIAANQIAMNVSYLVFTLPLSISVAATIRVGTEIGAGRPLGARRAALAAILLAISAAVINTGILISLSEEIARLYTHDAEVARHAARLLLFAAIFQLADAFVVPTQGALRGYKDTSIPLLLAVLAYWVITLPLGYALGLGDLLTAPKGAEGFWIALVVGLSLSGILMTARLRRISQAHVQIRTVSVPKTPCN
ncbi:MAG: MATE family efflux transporter [Gammaproteobacteria bacterium]|nr:MATE family efflux transporter [Gammaproteobacteria bacterium]